MINILILGDNWFVSRSLSKYLTDKNYEVDILTNEYVNIDSIDFRTHIICNRRCEDELNKVLKTKHYDIIFDISAYSKEDVEILFNCINPSSIKKYIFFSSAAVYTPSKEETFEDSKKGENSIFGNYSLGKLDAEKYITNLISNNNLNAIIFRPSYVYGEGNNIYRESFLFDKIKNNEIIYIPDDNIKIQFIYIQDLLKICECAIYNDHINRAYNVTSPSRISLRELIETCGKVLGIKPTIKTTTDNLNVENSFPFKSMDLNLNITDLRKNGFHLPVIYLDQGLNLTYKKTNGF
ncbi:NAD-dependent epimerase/dehydratase family protein [Clostridium chauvoei]|uniref:NAD-dependent epimerase/dehydratase family protein n=1 Tax=Clostridium chauvoei TaxID=46867 RepID=UPI001C86396F|nr:NAD-dependent epimerase/dehydratase family protein [Clostridium chauvoei]MBX7301661.1 NAD-dependent epimerase/dehydratase family protein [Clostridium chauvoei]